MMEILQLLIAAAVGWFLRQGRLVDPSPPAAALPATLIDQLRKLLAEDQKEQADRLLERLAGRK